MARLRNSYRVAHKKMNAIVNGALNLKRVVHSKGAVTHMALKRSGKNTLFELFFTLLH